MATFVKGICPSGYAWQNNLYLYIYLHITCNVQCCGRKNKKKNIGGNSSEGLSVRTFCWRHCDGHFVANSLLYIDVSHSG
jgi:hypothetical protein